MSRDLMRRPLKRLSLRQRLWARRPGAFAASAIALLCLFGAGGVALSLIPRPFAGEPVLVAAIPEEAELVTSSTTVAEDPPAPAEAAPEDVIDQSAVEIQGGEPLDQAPVAEPAYQQEAAIYVAMHRPLKKAPIDAVSEKTKDGVLPRIGKNGKKPFNVYSQVTPLAVTSSGRPKITLILGGMGLNPKLTQKAIDLLPGDVTLGFAPYGENLQAQVNKARAQGHEVLLQVPMEPVGYPGTNPGPNTLLSDAAPEKNLEALKWHMSRFAGYSGITNYMGSRLLSTEDALQPVLKELKSRGLVYLEDSSVSLSISPKVGNDLRLPMQRAEMVIDAEPTAAAITAALDKLEQQAAADGSAIATGSGLDVTIETVAEWAKTLQEKGILLVPVSTAYKGRAT
ncbi:divergent polysaccharide deacetylase family protein [Aestuariivirga sp.]|uniref:divergent polysaccharide deacetylase family protein n=1 Tax=Aestuariivirga sp. TaxID=2650926 RepID=UPI003BAD0A53